MTPERWERLKALFNGVLEQPASSRRAWLERQCAGDLTLLQEAEALLSAHDTAENYLEPPPPAAAPDEAPLPPGTRIGPKYVIEDVAGGGGMGIVYRAYDTDLKRPVALKALPPLLANRDELRARFQREAQATASIPHSGVATVYELAEFDGQLFIASEYVPGDTLRSVINRGPLPPARTAKITGDIARVLEAAHDAGVVHRDLKPENVLITPADVVKVIDFGIARIASPQSTPLTLPSALMGTPAYMAPEQLLGIALDGRADLYALGVMISEMLTGQHPLAERAATTRRADDPLFGHLKLIARYCMEIDPDRRYSSARALLAVLESAPGSNVAPRSEMPAPAPRPAAPSSPIFWWEFHQAMTALAYWLMAYPAWRGRGLIGGTVGRVFFIATLAAIIVGANLRLHLWFTSRNYPGELKRVRRLTARWIRLADWALAALLVAGGLLIGEDRSATAVILLSFGLGAALAFLFIEPATTRAAFKSSSTPRP